MDEVLNQRYLLTHKLGQGGFGAVYQATDLLLDREVAVKVLNIKEADQDDMVSRFLTEAKIASKLNHPNTLTIYDFGRNQEDCCYLVSELLLGESLHERLSVSALSVASSLEVLYQVSLALREAHFEKIVHRDIKPANIFLSDNKSDSSFTVKLLDFGIAKMLEGTSNTVTGQMMGTPHYMSPEQIINIKLVDHRTDIYSLGIVLYHMLMGTVPYDDDSYYAIMRHHMQSPMPPLELPDEPPSLFLLLQKLVTQMTVKDVRKRITSIEEVIQAIQDIWSEYPLLRQNFTPPTGENKIIKAQKTPQTELQNKNHLNATPYTKSEGEGYGKSADTLLSTKDYSSQDFIAHQSIKSSEMAEDEDLPRTLAPSEIQSVDFKAEQLQSKPKSVQNSLDLMSTISLGEDPALPIREISNGAIQAQPQETLQTTMVDLYPVAPVKSQKKWLFILVLIILAFYMHMTKNSVMNLEESPTHSSTLTKRVTPQILDDSTKTNPIVDQFIVTTDQSVQALDQFMEVADQAINYDINVSIKSQAVDQADSAKSENYKADLEIKTSKSKTSKSKTSKSKTSKSKKSKSKKSKSKRQEIKVKITISPNSTEYYVGDVVNVKANVSQGSKKINSHIRYTLPKFARWKKKNSKIEFIRKGQGKIRLCYHTTHCDFRRVQVVEKDEDIF